MAFPPAVAYQLDAANQSAVARLSAAAFPGPGYGDQAIALSRRMHIKIGVDEDKVIGVHSPDQRRAGTWRAAHADHPQVCTASQTRSAGSSHRTRRPTRVES